MKINEYVEKAHENARAHGWWDNPKSFGELISLIHSEASEALEEFRNGKEPTETYYSGKEKLEIETDSMTLINIVESPEKINGDMGIISNFGLDSFKVDKPEGIPSELADIVIRVFDLCGYYGINLLEAIDEKMEYNKNRPYKHGNKVL